jgi:hypothetical protein
MSTICKSLNRDVLTIIFNYNNDYEDLLNLSKLSELFKSVIYNNIIFTRDVTTLQEGLSCISLSKKARLYIKEYLYYSLTKSLELLKNNIYCLEATSPIILDIISSSKSLTILNLYGYNKLFDLKLLLTCKNLESLQIKNTNITNFDELSKLTSLKILYVNNLNLEDVTFISELINLEHLSITNSLVTSISCVNNINLKSLSVRCNNLTTININNENLINLDLSHNSIQDITCLSSCKKLYKLQINNTQVKDISCLHKNLNLKILEVENTLVTKEDIDLIKKNSKDMQVYS